MAGLLLLFDDHAGLRGLSEELGVNGLGLGYTGFMLTI
jgi:hypothetical protein